MVLPEVLRRGLHIGKGAKLAAAVVGDHIELKPYGESGVAAWPPGFFDRIAIDDPSFTRPAQGEMPEGVVLFISPSETLGRTETAARAALATRRRPAEAHRARDVDAKRRAAPGRDRLRHP